MTRAIAILWIALLAGCAEGPSRPDVLNALMGQPESEAVRVLGVPSRTFTSNGHSFLAFDDRQLEYVAAAPPFGPWGAFGPFGPYNYGYGYYIPPTVPVERVCETTLEVVGGRVASWSLRGSGC